MDIVVTILVGFGALLVGTFGFCQVVGSIKYWHSTPIPFVTIAIWSVILVAIAVIAHAFLSQHIIGFYIGYVAAFIKSLSVQPD